MPHDVSGKSYLCDHRNMMEVVHARCKSLPTLLNEVNMNKRSKQKQDYNKANYDRMEITVPKGQKAEIKAHAKKRGFDSHNAYINHLIEEDMKKEP
jgi:hypothetical protein